MSDGSIPVTILSLMTKSYNMNDEGEGGNLKFRIGDVDIKSEKLSISSV